MTKKLLLLAPPIFDFYFTPERREPLGLLYLKSSLIDLSDLQVEIYDATYTCRKKKILRPASFNYLDEYYVDDHSPFSLLRHYFRFGDSFTKIVAAIKDGGFALVGISSLFSAYHPDVEALVAKIKQETATTVVIGGWAIKADGLRLMQQSHADYFLSGDEVEFRYFVKRWIANESVKATPTLIYRELGELRHNPRDPLLRGSPPALEIIPKRERIYTFKNRKIAKMTMSRGCLNSCRFCAIHKHHEFAYRGLDRIALELEYLNQLGIDLVDFEDDNLFFNPAWSAALLELLAHYHDKGMSFTAMNGITATNLAPLVDDALRAGFVEFNLSLVTGSTATTSELLRPFSYKTIEEIVQRSSSRIDILVFLILGLPHSDPHILLSDILSLARLPVKIGVSPLYMLPDIAMFRDLGLPDDHRLLRGSALYKFGDHFSRNSICSLWKIVRMLNYLRENKKEDHGEYIDYFWRSLDEQRWYHKAKSGHWYQGVNTDLRLSRKEKSELQDAINRRL